MVDKKTKKGPPPSNRDYHAVWNKFVGLHKHRANVLLPLEVGLAADKDNPSHIIIERDRITSAQVEEIWKGIKWRFPDYINELPEVHGNPEEIFTDYIQHFDMVDKIDNPPGRTPLDLDINHPTWLMFVLKTENIKFCEHGPAYSVENDADNQTRNFEMVAMFDDPRIDPCEAEHGEPVQTRKILILANRNRSAPRGLKYNLHVDILQTLKVGRKEKRMSTTVIIDPGGGNNPNPPYGNGGD